MGTPTPMPTLVPVVRPAGGVGPLAGPGAGVLVVWRVVAVVGGTLVWGLAGLLGCVLLGGGL